MYVPAVDTKGYIDVPKRVDVTKSPPSLTFKTKQKQRYTLLGEYKQASLVQGYVIVMFPLDRLLL